MPCPDVARAAFADACVGGSSDCWSPQLMLFDGVERKMKTAVVGIGRWGKNLVRCFDELVEVNYCCHTGDPENAAWLRDSYPHIELTDSYSRIIEDDEVDAVVIATPVESHASIANRAVRSGKHVFVEKPLADTPSASREIVSLANDRNRCLFTGYVFLYSPAMRQLYEMTREDPPRHIRTTWEKLGSFDSSIVHSLASHDIAIGQYLFKERFVETDVHESIGVCTGSDILSATLRTEGGKQLCLSYDRTARSTRKSVIVVTESGERLEFVDDRLTELDGDEHREIDHAPKAEPLMVECRTFVDWVDGNNEAPPSSGQFGADVDMVLGQLQTGLARFDLA